MKNLKFNANIMQYSTLNLQKTVGRPPSAFTKLMLILLLLSGSIISSYAQLAGNYTVDPSQSASATNYLTIGDAISDLINGTRQDGGTVNGPGVSDSVVVWIADGTYQEQLHITYIQGISASTPVTFRGNAGKVKLTYGTSSQIGNSYVMKLTDVSHVLLWELDFELSDYNNDARLLSLESDVSHIEVSECSFKGGGSKKVELVKLQYSSSNFMSDISFKGCAFSNAYSGIDGIDPNNGSAYATGISSWFSTFTDIKYGIRLENAREASVEKCVFANSASAGITGAAAISFIDGANIRTINTNKITLKSGTGIYIDNSPNSGSTTTDIYNNMISINALNANAGIEISRSNNFRVVHNSIYVRDTASGVYDNSLGYTPRALGFSWTNGSSSTLNHTLEFYNNIIEGFRGVNLLLDAAAGNIDMDHNAYKWDQAGYLAVLGADSISGLSQWRTATMSYGYGQNSLDIDPEFVSSTDLHAKNPLLRNGLPVSYVSYDIDGQFRPATPCIGAEEIDVIIPYIQWSGNNCNGGRVSFSASVQSGCGAITSYSWDFGDGTTESMNNPTHVYTAKGIYTVTLSIKTLGGCTGIDTARIIVNEDCVWPGDANSDKKVKLSDILYVGLAYGDTGAVRPNASIYWGAEMPPQNWTDSFASGLNHKYADCNGDGKVDTADIYAVDSNYNKTHQKMEETLETMAGAPPLTFEFPTDSLKPGKSYKVKILLGDAGNQALDMYGLDFVFDFDPDIIDSGSFALDLKNSWLKGSGQNQLISLVKPDHGSGEVALAISRTNQQNTSGYGMIGELDIVIKDDVAGKTLESKDLKLGFKSYTAISANESLVSLDAVDAATKVYFDESGIGDPDVEDRLALYPNPSNGQFTIQAGNETVRRIAVMNALGQTVWSDAGTHTGNISLDLTSMEKGLYYIQITTASGTAVKRLQLK